MWLDEFPCVHDSIIHLLLSDLPKPRGMCTVAFHFQVEVVYTKIRPWSFNNLHEEVTKCPWFLFLLLLSLSKPVSMASWGVPYEQLMKEEKQFWCTGGFDVHAIQAPPKSGQLQHHSSLLERPWSTWWREISQWFLILLVKRSGQRCEFISVHGLWPMVWLDSQGFGREILENWW